MAKRNKEKSKNLDLLIENSVSLQKTLVNVAVNLDKLTKEISRLLQLFEEASKSFKGKWKKSLDEKGGEEEDSTKPDSSLKEKLDNLVEQNKTIARGLLLLETALKEKIGGRPKPLPEFRL